MKIAGDVVGGNEGLGIDADPEGVIVTGVTGIVIEADDDGVADGSKTVEAVERENREEVSTNSYCCSMFDNILLHTKLHYQLSRLYNFINSVGNIRWTTHA